MERRIVTEQHHGRFFAHKQSQDQSRVRNLKQGGPGGVQY